MLPSGALRLYHGHMAKSTASFYRNSFIGFTTFVLIWVAGSACSSNAKQAEQTNRQSGSAALPDEVSLKADRIKLDRLRKDVPAETRKENDELALILDTMKNSDEEPSQVRERFNRILRERRTVNDRDLRKLRDDFSSTERRNRESFLRDLQAERDKFTKRKTTSEERQKFFNDQDTRRREFFATNGEKRNTFEATSGDRRKTFEDYAREKTNQFNQLHREYTTEFYERRKNEALKKRSEEKAKKASASPAPDAAASGAANPFGEWQNIPKGPATPLGVPPSDGK
jgi:hypothetical protein